MSAFLVFAAVVVAYSNHFSGPFELDDVHTIVQNEWIRDIRNVPRFFTDATTFSSLPANQSYRPGTTTLNAVDIWLGGTGKPEPRVFHASVFASFLLFGVILYSFLLAVLRQVWNGAFVRWVALGGAGFFLLHTANAETINYVIARADSFSTSMVVLAFVVYLCLPKLRRSLLYLVPIAVGALVKEPAVVFGPLLLVYLLLFREELSLADLVTWRGLAGLRRAVVSAGPALVLGVALFAVGRAMTPPTFSPGGTSHTQYLLTQPFVLFHYFKNFLVPVGLAVESDWTAFTSPFDDRTWAGVGFVLLLLAFAVRASRRPEGRPVAFGILWFFIALAPTSSLVALAEVLNDHRPFFAYVGLTLAACGLVAGVVARYEKRLTSSLARRAVLFVGVAALLTAHAVGVHQRNEVWASSESLWGDAARKGPGSGRILMNYGLALMARGDLRGALESFERARAVWPNYSYIHINLGVVKAAMGDTQRADGHFEDALALDPRNPEAYSFYATFLRAQGREQEAVLLAQRGLALSPSHIGLRAFPSAPTPSPVRAAAPTPEDLLNVSLAHYRGGRFEESLAAAREAAKTRPNWDLAWNNVCAAANRLGRFDEAIAAGEKAVSLNPANELARNNLGEARRLKAKSAGPS